MMNAEELIYDWFTKEQRTLPWRNTKDSYRIWISEIMLQQTRVETVKDYYLRFMEKYPNDMKVYYESEDFICYVMPQNMYHQYNFAIDYRYNQNKMQDETAEDTQDETQQQSEATNETQQQSDASGKQEAGK